MLTAHELAPKIAVAIARELAGFLWAALQSPADAETVAGATRSQRARAAQVTDAHRYDSEDRRASYATRTPVPTRAPGLHVLSTKHCHACSVLGDQGNHRISA